MERTLNASSPSHAELITVSAPRRRHCGHHASNECSAATMPRPRPASSLSPVASTTVSDPHHGRYMEHNGWQVRQRSDMKRHGAVEFNSPHSLELHVDGISVTLSQRVDEDEQLYTLSARSSLSPMAWNDAPGSTSTEVLGRIDRRPRYGCKTGTDVVTIANLESITASGFASTATWTFGVE